MEATPEQPKAPLPKIPSPAGSTFREFRIRVAPGLVFGLTLVVAWGSWRNYVGPTQVVGEVESSRAIVSSMVAGRLSQLSVGPLDTVRAGQPIAVLLPVDPKVLDAQASVIKARIDVARLGVIPLLRKQNNYISFQQVRLELMKEKTTLASAKAQLVFNELELTRAKQLMSGTGKDAATLPAASQQQLDWFQSKVDESRGQVRELEVIIASSEEWIKSMAAGEEEVGQEAPESIKAAIGVEQRNLELLEAQMSPITLTAPIDGVVSMIYHHPGEPVAASEPIITISATNTSRIVAFVRQPLTFEPRTGMQMEVRSRVGAHRMSRGQVLKVGRQLESVLPELLPHAPSGGHVTAEFGLPLLVTLPTDLQLHPGEIVDLRPVPDP